MNDTGDLYTPEMKVKRLLDSLGYFMLLGNTSGIETDYRKMMHARREIPASNCPTQIENMLYSTGGGTEALEQEEESSFNLMLERLDARGQSYHPPKKRYKRYESGQHKRSRIGIHDGEWITVDTENKFWFNGEHYVINDQAAQYAPVETIYGSYYAMDRVLACNGRFFDMNYDEVAVQRTDNSGA